MRRQRHGSNHQDLDGPSRDSEGLQDLLITPPALPGSSSLDGQELVMLQPSQIIEPLSLPSIPALSNLASNSQATLSSANTVTTLPLALPSDTEQHKEKPSYTLFSTNSGNAKRAVKEKVKEKETKTIMVKENFHGSQLPSTTTANSLSEGSCHALSDSISSEVNILLQALHPLPAIRDPANSLGDVTVVSSMEVMLGQIVEELQAIKVSQEEARKETKVQLSQINFNRIHLSTRVSQAKQRVSDLEETNKQQESATSQIQSELEVLQFKLDEGENRSRCSNLRFLGVPEEIESLSVTKVISDLIYKCILPEKPVDKDDLSIMWAHRVPPMHATNSKYLRTILVNFGDYRIK
ncbi:hypothetical protein NDU88_002479 [Pleurodeles waltl]|uniref:Uncharacterized protein n=1 Tax=Pleurodeles waltl TaxID=8319 RepID=A0AAV7SAI0_PLEWA|nr:hypothetical protein NDU88_002479 [Pleurodeles waltl]